MGGSSHETQQTNQVQQNQIDPEQKALLMGNYATAQGNAAKLNQPYGGVLTAGFNPTQTQTQGLLSGLAQDPRYMNTANAATSAIGGVLGSPLSGNINAQNVSASPYTASTYNPAQLAGTDLNPYMNPFQKNVIDASIAQNGYARAQQGVADNAAATAAHAFGGSRQGVQAAETTGQYDRNNQQNLAALNSANFGQAQNAAGNDINARNTASQFNAGAGNSANQFNSSQGLNAGIFNATQNQNAQQQSFGNNMASQQGLLAAAAALQGANNNALNTATQQAGLLGAVGDVQQQQQQTEYGNEYQNWLTGQNMTAQEQSILNSALGLMPNQQTVTTNGTANATKTTNPGATDILSGVGSLGMGLGSMGLGFADVRPKVLRFDHGNRRLASFRYVPEVSDLREAA